MKGVVKLNVFAMLVVWLVFYVLFFHHDTR